MSRLRLLTVFLLIFASMAVPQLQAAQPHPGSETKPADKEGEPGKTLSITAKTSVTRHTVSIGGKEYRYTATAGFLPLTSEAGDPEAEIFSTSYTLDTPKGAAQRPIMFVFNGGPGAASVWLHLGALGPRRVEMLPDGNMPAPPFRLVDNGSSWLDLGDLVFVDPVGTGYSRASKPDLAKGYATVRGDIDSLVKFVRLYLTRNERWNSPIYLVGESYGTFRCAGMADQLAEHGVALNGIILISSVLNFQTISFDNGNDLPFQLFLPSYTATAWYHKKLAPELMQDLERTVSEAENWAGSEYQLALNKGDRLSPGERREVVAKLSRYTGLSPALVDNLNLRIDGRTFVRELLRDQRRTVGYMDSRFNAANVDPAASSGFDPTVTTIRPPYTSLVNSYLREELGFKSDLEYYTLGGGIGHWDWETKNGYADTSDNLRNTMAKNPYMKVFVASGLFDLATPHFATDYTLAHLGLTPPLRQNITTHRYRSGHMMYLEKESLTQLKRDVADFIAASSKVSSL